MAIIAFLILFSLLIFVHEGGHFIAAKLFGVKVEEFGFGYPPRIFGKKVGETIYSVNLIPFGGFARIKGMVGDDPGAEESDSFAAQSKRVRSLILCGGILGNFVLAWALFVILFAIGNPVPAGKVLVEEVVQGLPAESIGIAAGDYIISFGGERVESADALIVLIDKNIGESVVIEVETGGEVRTVSAAPEVDPSGDGRLMGFTISTGVDYERVAAWRLPLSSLVETVRDTGLMVKFAFTLIRDLLRGEEVQVGGPVAIFAMTETYVSYGIRIFLQFVALLSINLMIVNLFPIPALDGGRLLFIAYEAIRGKKPSPRAEQFINNLGFALLIGLMILITIKDIRTFF